MARIFEGKPVLFFLPLVDLTDDVHVVSYGRTKGHVLDVADFFYETRDARNGLEINTINALCESYENKYLPSYKKLTLKEANELTRELSDINWYKKEGVKLNSSQTRGEVNE